MENFAYASYFLEKYVAFAVADFIPLSHLNSHLIIFKLQIYHIAFFIRVLIIQPYAQENVLLFSV